MTLYEKIEEAFMKLAENATPGNNWVIGETNQVPQKLAEIATQIVYEHQNAEENTDEST